MKAKSCIANNSTEILRLRARVVCLESSKEVWRNRARRCAAMIMGVGIAGTGITTVIDFIRQRPWEFEALQITGVGVFLLITLVGYGCLDYFRTEG